MADHGGRRLVPRALKRASAGTALAGVVLLLGGGIPAEAQSGRRLIDLGTLGGNWTGVTDLNNRREAVGGASDAEGIFRAFLWSNGKLRDIGPHDGSPTASAGDINDRGQAIGNTFPHRRLSHAFLWSDGRTTALPTLGGDASNARAINERGQVVGSATDAAGVSHAVLWEDGQVRDLGPGTALLLNDRGQVVLANNEGIWLWERGRTTRIGPDAGDGVARTLGPRAINNRGTVIGDSYVAGRSGTGSFIWRRGTLTELPPSPDEWACQQALVLNDRDDIAGSSGEGGACHAIRRRGLGPAVVLASLGGPSSYATAINNHGDIAGVAQTEGGDRSWAVLWADGRIINLGALPGGESSQAVAVNDRQDVAAFMMTAGGTVMRSFLSVPSPGGG